MSSLKLPVFIDKKASEGTGRRYEDAKMAMESAKQALYSAEKELWEAFTVLQLEMTGKTSKLTRQELKVLHLIKHNMANKEIADVLHIAERTVKFHVSSILRKQGCTSRRGLL